jgi:hypothetical protein
MLVAVGRAPGGLTSTNIICAKRKIEHEMGNDAAFAEELEALERCLLSASQE